MSLTRRLISGLRLVAVAWLAMATAAAQSSLDREAIHKAATNAHSLFLNDAEKTRAIDTFIQLVRIKGISGQEQSIRQEVQHLLTGVGAVPVPGAWTNKMAPCNLVLEFAGSGPVANRPALAVNAHLDTIARCNPDLLAFDPGSGDFYHQDEAAPGRSSSFGGDDRSSIAVLVEALRVLQADHWTKGVPHRRILMLFTADEERGCVGAKYLAEHQPDLFGNLEATFSMDGPLDFRSEYPRDAFIAVVSEADSASLPYKKVLGLLQECCRRRQLRFARTEIGLGMGDFGAFPASAHAGLHLRSPVRGFHAHERVRVQDFINHIDLVCFLLLGWDNSLPTKSSETDSKSNL